MTHLYRYFDQEGNLLYVGISINLLLRHMQHRNGSHWFAKAKRMSWDTFETRPEAEAAEKAAIKAENPRHNIDHNDNDEPTTGAVLRAKQRRQQPIDYRRSAATRARMSAAQKARWAKERAA